MLLTRKSEEYVIKRHYLVQSITERNSKGIRRFQSGGFRYDTKSNPQGAKGIQDGQAGWTERKVERRMRVGLVDCNSHNFPNLPLMKISSYHKQLGNIVEFADVGTYYDVLYVSKIFTESKIRTVTDYGVKCFGEVVGMIWKIDCRRK